MPDRRYETLLLLHPDLGEAGAQEQTARIRSLVEQNGAAVAGVHAWGQHELAYPIRDQRRALFALIEFRASGSALLEIERNLRLMEPVLRFLTVKVDEDAPPACELRPIDVRAAGGSESGRPRERAWEGRGRRDAGEDETDVDTDDAETGTESDDESTMAEEGA